MRRRREIEAAKRQARAAADREALGFVRGLLDDRDAGRCIGYMHSGMLRDVMGTEAYSQRCPEALALARRVAEAVAQAETADAERAEAARVAGGRA